MRAACNDHFEMVRSVCNGTKHAIANPSHAIPFVAGRDHDRPPSIAGVARGGRSLSGDTRGARVVRHNENNYNLYSSVKSVLAEFKSQFPSQPSGCDMSGC
jgi:hypothetical protein